MHTALVELTRGSLVESVHAGSAALADVHGRLVAWVGDPDASAFLRSSAKPFQAISFVESGAADAFGLEDDELAIVCGSHIGTDAHVDVVRRLQAKTGLAETDLLCGTHNPPDGKTMRAMVLRGEEPSPLRHNCSGKHSGMLASARFRWGGTLSPDGLTYIETANPIQRDILATFAALCGLPDERVTVGIDGCSAPNFAVPLRNAATAAARLMDPTDLPDRRAAACRRITRAMTDCPDLVRGEGRFDSELMRAGHGVVFSKAGAEGYQILGIAPGALGIGSPALGVAIKIADGDGADRAASLAALTVLDQLGWPEKLVSEGLQKFRARPLTNWRGLTVGEIRACFQVIKIGSE
jgi:L-asparaginase II